MKFITRLFILLTLLITSHTPALTQNQEKKCVEATIKSGERMAGNFINLNADYLLLQDGLGRLQVIKRAELALYTLTPKQGKEPCSLSNTTPVVPKQPEQPKAPVIQPTVEPVKPTLNSVRWQLDSPDSDTIFRQGREVRSITNNGISVYVVLNSEDKYTEAVVRIINDSGARTLFNPKISSFEIMQPKPLALSVMDPNRVAHSLENRGRWANFFTAMAAGMARKQSTGSVYDNRGNSATVTVDEPDVEAQRNASRAIEARRAKNQSDADFVRENALLINTLFSGESVMGILYFEKKPYSSAVLKIAVGDTLYEFPYPQ